MPKLNDVDTARLAVLQAQDEKTEQDAAELKALLVKQAA